MRFSLRFQISFNAYLLAFQAPQHKIFMLLTFYVVLLSCKLLKSCRNDTHRPGKANSKRIIDKRQQMTLNPEIKSMQQQKLQFACGNNALHVARASTIALAIGQPFFPGTTFQGQRQQQKPATGQFVHSNRQTPRRLSNVDRVAYLWAPMQFIQLIQHTAIGKRLYRQFSFNLHSKFCYSKRISLDGMTQTFLLFLFKLS